MAYNPKKVYVHKQNKKHFKEMNACNAKIKKIIFAQKFLKQILCLKVLANMNIIVPRLKVGKPKQDNMRWP